MHVNRPIGFTMWIALIEQLEPGQFSISFQSKALPDMNLGDGVILVNDANDVVGIARVYRQRVLSSGTFVYFDKLLLIKSGTANIDNVVLKPSSTQQVVRTDRTTFDTVVTLATGKPFSDLPSINGSDPQQQAYIRDLLQIALSDDILGPASGLEEEIAGMSVRDRYLVGKLAPSKGGRDREQDGIEGLQGPTAELDELQEQTNKEDLQPLAEIGEGKDKGARRQLPGQEFSSTFGFRDPDDEDTIAVDASKNQSFVPSSVGLTFCVEANVHRLLIDVSWGRYERITSETHVSEDGVGKRVWKRFPAGGSIQLDVVTGLVTPVAPDRDWPQVLIQGTIRAPLSTNERLITLFLVNDQPEVERNQDERWVFQPVITISDQEGRSIFRKRPVLSSDGQDSERESLEMIYRDCVEFAVGHGISVHADCDDTNHHHAFRLQTTVLPQFEVPVTETPGLETTDRAAMKDLVAAGTLDMQTLASIDRGQLIPSLSLIIQDSLQLTGDN